jgi:hypothetical protein
MPYTADKPPVRRTSEELRATIPGWGVDLDPKDRPAVPKENFTRDTGAHWDFPERQVERAPRERSIEHQFLTPVFGTSAPTKGFSGALRKYAYSAFSEGQTAHWMLLVAADRIDVVESNVGSLLHGHPDNPITETGILGELKAHPIRSRIGQHRADLKHQPLDPVIVAAPWLLMGGAAYMLAKSLRPRIRHENPYRLAGR